MTLCWRISMKRSTPLPACVLSTSGCADLNEPLSPLDATAERADLLSAAGAALDPLLAGQLNQAGATDRLEVIINFDELLTTGSVLGPLVRGTGAGVVTFRNLPMVAAVATPEQIAL